MSNGATAAFRHMLQIGLHGACIASRGSHGLQRAFRGSLKLLSRGRVLGTYICSGVINSGHENTVPYSGCSASLSNRLRLGGNCATNFGQGSRGDTQNTFSPNKSHCPGRCVVHLVLYLIKPKFAQIAIAPVGLRCDAISVAAVTLAHNAARHGPGTDSCRLGPPRIYFSWHRRASSQLHRACHAARRRALSSAPLVTQW